MPKLKTKKGVAKRIRLTKRGKMKYPPCGKSHHLTSKKSKRLRALRRPRIIGSSKDIKYINKMLPYR